MDADTIDLIIRSRPTICEILSNRGYDVDEYKDVSPKELVTMTTTNVASLRIIAKKREGGAAPMERVVVRYCLEGVLRLSLPAVTKMFDPEEDEDPVNAATDELLLLHNEPHHDAFTAQAQKQWIERKARVSFFSLKNLISNPARHILVPPHRKLTADETATAMKRLFVDSKGQLPHIKFHADMQARVLGLVPGDVVEIQRPSDAAGVTTIFRVCTV